MHALSSLLSVTQLGFQARREACDDHFDDDKKEEKYGWRQQHVKPEFGRWSIVEAFPQPVHLAVMRRGGGRAPPSPGQAQKKKHQAQTEKHHYQGEAG